MTAIRRRGSNDHYLAELAQLRGEVAALKAQQVRFVEAPVTDVDVSGETFTVTIIGQDGQLTALPGISASGTFLPEPGQTVRIAVAGAQPILHPTGLAVNAVTGREIAPGAVQEENLAFNLADFGGSTVFYGPSTPTAEAIGDLWLKIIDNGPPPVAETYRWDGDSWELVYDQRATQALLDAAAAQGAADDAAALAGLANTAAGTAQDTAEAAEQAAAAAALAADSAVIATALNRNPNFTDWTGSYPEPWLSWSGGAPTKETALARSKPHAARWAPAAASDAGMQTNATGTGALADLPLGLPYITVEVDFYLVSGTANGAGVLLDWDGMTGSNRAALNLGAEVSAAQTGKWYRVSKVIPRPAGATGTATGWKTWLMANSSLVGTKTAKDIIFDRIVYRPSTSEEVTALTAAAAAAAAQATADTKITTYKQASAPASGMVTGDFWLDSDDGNKAYRWSGSTWELVQDQAIVTALNNAATAQATADGKVRIFVQASAPAGLGAGDVGDMWIDTDNDNKLSTWSGSGWVDRLLGNGSIQPNSLVASNVIATGTVSAALLEAILVLTTSVIAGDATGDHARMTPTGFRVFRADPDGTLVPEEVIRMGTDTNDFFAVVASNGELAASVDDTGVGSLSGLHVPWLRVNGTELEDKLAEYPLGEVARFNDNRGTDLQFWDRVGVCEVGAALYAGRAYRIDWRAVYRVTVANNEVRFKLHSVAGDSGDVLTEPPAPDINSPQIATFYFTGTSAGRWFQAQGSMQFYPSFTSRRRILLTVERGVPNTLDNAFIVGQDDVELMITDLGPAGATSGHFTTAGGVDRGVPTTPPPPTSVSQQYFVDLAPAGWASYRGNGSLRTDYNGIVQGWDPSGFNGDGGGFWWWNLPSITGTVDRVDLYCYTDHWYYNAGGTAIFNIIPGGVTSNFDSAKLRTDWHQPGYAKPGGKTVILPADWWPQFKNTPPSGPRAIGITAGRSDGTNLTYYGKFQGPSARLRIWYTQ